MSGKDGLNWNQQHWMMMVVNYLPKLFPIELEQNRDQHNKTPFMNYKTKHPLWITKQNYRITKLLFWKGKQFLKRN